MGAAEGRFSCPKSMEYGPCGGVSIDGSCEVASDHACVFLDVRVVRWRGDGDARGEAAVAGAVTRRGGGDRTAVAGGGARGMGALIAERQIVVADFPGRALDVVSLGECARVLAGRVDAVLAGDSGQSRVQFSPTFRASLMQSHGLKVWSGINCRDRNRVAIEGELAGLAAVGVAGVHCVTGDHTQTGSRPDALPVFDLDSTRVAALAAAAGLLVSVGETPATPPTASRAGRLVQKQRAGAEIAFVNHAGGVHAVERFIGEVRELQSEAGLGELGYIACIPVVVDRGSAELLKSFTTLVLPDGFLERILGARDVYAEGVAAAAELAAELAALDGVVGINLSGGPEEGRETFFAEALAEVAGRVPLRSFGG